MKKSIFISLLFLSCIFTANAQWQQVLKAADPGPIFPYRGVLICCAANGINLSYDTGTTWQIGDTTAIGKGTIQFSAIDSLLFLNVNDTAIYISADSGRSWKPTAVLPSIPGGTKITSFTCSGKNLLVGVNMDSMYLSTNYGKSWVSSGSGLPHPAQYTSATYSQFINIGNATIVFWGNSSYISYNHGHTWSHKADNCPGSSSVILIGNDIYVAAGNYVFRSADSTLTWTKVFSGIPVMEDMCTDRHYILVADLYLGVIFSKDSGDRWTIINNGLPNDNVSSVAILGSYIFCGSYTGLKNLYRMSLSGAAGVPDTIKYISGIKPLPVGLPSLNIYPDPVQHSATINFGRQLQNGSLQIFNSQGKRVQQIDQITNQKIILQPNNLAPGTYTYLLTEQGKKTAAGKFIIQ